VAKSFSVPPHKNECTAIQHYSIAVLNINLTTTTPLLKKPYRNLTWASSNTKITRMIKVSTFLWECLNEIEMKKYLPPYERELTSFPQRSSESLCSVDGTCTTPHASAGAEMFQGKNKIKYKFGWWLCCVPIPLPPQRSRRARQLRRGRGGLKFFWSMEPSCMMAPTDIEVDWITTMIQGDIEICLARDHTSSPVVSQIEM
jgi:hypothetical protein